VTPEAYKEGFLKAERGLPQPNDNVPRERSITVGSTVSSLDPTILLPFK
jgi:hypothetical protein